MEDPLEVENWKRISILGSGAFGVVSLWKNGETEEFIAIKKCKFISPKHLTANHRRRWENEVNIIKTLRNDNIVSFKELPKNLDSALQKHNPSGLPILSMEYCTKGNLRHVLNQPKNSSGLQENDVREVLTDISEAISYLHKQNITHRDIKPENIVLQEYNSRQSGVIYKLIDLGYAKEINDSNVSFVGTLHYLAPEILKTESYNHCVDYWSLGILCFEILCGVLPFLPQFTPFERFQYIEKKKPEDICIYQMRSGTVTYRSEIHKENHISSCLKQHLEVWLRHVLSFDKKKRLDNVSGDVTVFDYLDNVLKKKIVTVFSVYTTEFYSYEINENTFVSTLKEWIGRDIRVPAQEQLLLTNSHQFNIVDNNFVVDYVTDDDLLVYVLRKGSFIKRELQKQLPMTISYLFENCTKKFKWRELRPLYTKSLFFLTQDSKTISFLSKVFDLYLKSFDSINSQLRLAIIQSYNHITNLLGKIKIYCNIRNEIFTQILVNNSPNYWQLLTNFQELISLVERAIQNVNKLLKKKEVFKKRQNSLKRLLPKTKTIIESCSIDKRVADATMLLTKSPDEIRNDLSCKEMAKIISQALKDQDLLLNNKHFRNYTKALSVAHKDCETLLLWTKQFSQHIQYLDKSIDRNQKDQYEVIFKQMKNSMNNYSLLPLDAKTVIQENTDLRYKFQDVMSEIFCGLADIRQDCENIF